MEKWLAFLLDHSIPLIILILALWLTFRPRREMRSRKRPEPPPPRGGSDWSLTREGQQDHLTKRREEDGG